jgi:diaminohydroxyphosphoribosylaminopyrimidine deaminase/5-amino-6-(5-phosphoribosylamino)uracil reductase
MASTTRSVFDTHMMAIALRLAQRGLGQTAPNPSVGSVIADEATRTIIARGWTAQGGRPHAEVEALKRAGQGARGACLYVTLEPCSHHGATPPCADAVIDAGIARVVCAIEDPDPRVAGRGLARLRQAGIAVERGLMANEAHWMAAGHILRVTERRPLVQAKLALAPDGSVPRGAKGQPAWVTSKQSRALGHLLRARADAILVGRKTVVDDDPQLNCRLPGLEDRSPIRIVLASQLAGLSESQLVKTACSQPVWIFCGEDRDVRSVAMLERAGARIFPAAEVAGELWLPGIMETLVAEGVTRLLVEGGPLTWGAFSRAGLIDEVVAFQAQGPTGRSPPDPVALQVVGKYIATDGLELCDHRALSGDDMMVFRRPWRSLARGSGRSETA